MSVGTEAGLPLMCHSHARKQEADYYFRLNVSFFLTEDKNTLK